jgi:hypothetical protein
MPDPILPEQITWQLRAEKAEALLAEYEGALCWDTTCLNCASLLDANYREFMRREIAEEALEHVGKILAVHRLPHPDVLDDCITCQIAAVVTLWRHPRQGARP